ncbi:alpha-ketoacid dehydrogenase subunit beta [Natronoglycomyces albus]|uniref:Alpha-ketoacid dehydrogenase subunit beta n=1 Tax=Natronoglycomyces albus TaxID=2811108 RepID=A0A895XJC9_9ACTN|nr:alpha-ketoacid dehydrogenase subunit beta [Natronoglycomyces albus]QSB05444.1 alpha-ketoacid dehydrogenase subunit beta [Natronoglycomyces albus]
MSTKMPLVKALNEGLRRTLEDHPKSLIQGEDVGKLGGVFRVTDGLQKDFGEDRVVDSPLAEAGIVGTAIGLAIRGWRPVCEIQFDGFVYPAFNEIVSQLAKMPYRSSGLVSLPVVIRIPYGGGIGAIEHHCESPEAYFCHTAGLRVVAPSTPNDAYWMIQQAVSSDDPVIFMEPKVRYHTKGEVNFDAAPLPLHSAQVVREGTDGTLIAYGAMVQVALDAAEAAAEDGRSLEVIDMRSLSPIDWPTLEASARKTGRVVVVHEASRSFSVSSEVAARLSEECFYSLEAPVQRVTGFDIPFPASRHEDLFRPDLDRVLEAVDRSFDY